MVANQSLSSIYTATLIQDVCFFCLCIQPKKSIISVVAVFNLDNHCSKISTCMNCIKNSGASEVDVYVYIYILYTHESMFKTQIELAKLFCVAHSALESPMLAQSKCAWYLSALGNGVQLLKAIVSTSLPQRYCPQHGLVLSSVTHASVRISQSTH